MQMVGMPTVAIGTSSLGLITRSSSKRKKKYHSGRGTYVVVVGSVFGPSSAPRMSDIATITRFYALHMLLVPGLIAALIGAHLYLVAKLGTTAPPWLKAEKARDLAKEEI